jgi:hypothetical protein
MGVNIRELMALGMIGERLSYLTPIMPMLYGAPAAILRLALHRWRPKVLRYNLSKFQ